MGGGEVGSSELKKCWNGGLASGEEGVKRGFSGSNIPVPHFSGSATPGASLWAYNKFINNSMFLWIHIIVIGTLNATIKSQTIFCETFWILCVLELICLFIYISFILSNLWSNLDNQVNETWTMVRILERGIKCSPGISLSKQTSFIRLLFCKLRGHNWMLLAHGP